MAGTLKVGTITTPSGSGTITIPSGVTLSGHMYPAFFAYPSSSQTATQNTVVKISFQTEVYDTNNAFADSKFTVPSGQDGKYYIYASVFAEAPTNGTLELTSPRIYINGVQTFYNANDFRTNQIRGFTSTVSGSFNLVAGDYVEIYNYYYSSASQNGGYGYGNQSGTYFGGYKIGV